MSQLAIFSFPRSGRAFARKLLFPEGTPDEDMFGGPIYMSHDFDNDDVRDDRPNIVLARDPLYCFASWFEMETRNGNITDSREAFRQTVLNIWAPYWRKFAAKHILSGRAPVVWFDWFTQNPEAFADFITEVSGVEAANRGLRATPTRKLRLSKYLKPTDDLYFEITKALGPEYHAAINLAGPFA